MKWNNYTRYPSHFSDDKVFDACGISGYINTDGKLEDGAKIIDMITCLQDRENGLGAGYAIYGCFPDRKDDYCIQVISEDAETRDLVREFLKKKGTVVHDEKIETGDVETLAPPVLWRFFFQPSNQIPVEKQDDYIMDVHMTINDSFNRKVFVMSSGKNMAVFKGNGWSYEIADFYKIKDYKGYMWLGHSRFPTNTPGSWFGAHPFSLLSWSVIHNGEITSYGTNKRYLEMFGYKCNLLTDTEVLAYLFDLLVRRHKVPVALAAMAFNPPLYEEISQMPEDQQKVIKNIRMAYRSALVNGPFSIAVGSVINEKPTLITLTDRKKLRPQLIGMSEDGKRFYVSSEEASFERLQLSDENHEDFAKIWPPHAGTPFVARVGDGLVRDGLEAPFQKIEIDIDEKPPGFKCMI
ncbi:MAG: glutamine amidotransferase family protein [Candidatus Hodarchaeota archaeon]